MKSMVGYMHVVGFLLFLEHIGECFGSDVRRGSVIINNTLNGTVLSRSEVIKKKNPLRTSLGE